MTKFGRSQIDPSHNAGDDRVMLGQFEEPSCFVQRLSRLYRNASLKVITREFIFQILGCEIPAKRAHGFVDPAILASIVLPEMLMCVDIHACFQSGIGVTPREFES